MTAPDPGPPHRDDDWRDVSGVLDAASEALALGELVQSHTFECVFPAPVLLAQWRGARLWPGNLRRVTPPSCGWLLNTRLRTHAACTPPCPPSR